MKYSFRILFLPLLICLALPGSLAAAVIFKPNEKKTGYRAPGEEEVSGTAARLFAQAQEAEQKGNLAIAIKAYRTIVNKHSRDTLAPHACFRLGQLQEKTNKFTQAAGSYATVAERYQKSDYFDESVDGLFRLGEMYLRGQKTRILGIPVKSGLKQAVRIFNMIIRTAPYGKYTARAQFDLGLAYEKQHENEAAIAAYQQIVEKFPDDPIAVDAQYQIGYIYSKASNSGTYDPATATHAKIGFEDFLARYPNSEKAKQARENMKRMEQKQTSTAYQIAKFYDKQKRYGAAAIYYNEVIRQQPSSVEGERAKKRISELRAKVGGEKLQSPSVTAAAANKKKSRTPRTSGENEAPPSSNETAPLPAPDVDTSLPPPASLLPDSTTAPPSSSTESSPAPTPESTASP